MVAYQITNLSLESRKSTLDTIRRVLEASEKTKKTSHKHKEFCLLVTFDIKGVFNLANWKIIIDEIKRT